MVRLIDTRRARDATGGSSIAMPLTFLRSLAGVGPMAYLYCCPMRFSLAAVHRVISQFLLLQTLIQRLFRQLLSPLRSVVVPLKALAYGRPDCYGWRPHRLRWYSWGHVFALSLPARASSFPAARFKSAMRLKKRKCSMCYSWPAIAGCFTR